MCSHTVVLSTAKSSAAKSAVICFEWLQRPENVVAGHIKWTGYRTGSKPTIRIEHHKPGAVIDHQLESRILDDRFHEICVVEQAELVERTACWRIPRLRSAKRGAVSWQDGGERSNWQ